MDFGLLLIRVVLGSVMAAHGSQKLFGAFGGHGIAGTGAFLESMGFRPGRRHAEMAGITELGAGALLALGLLTPLAAAGFIGVMVVAGASAHGKAFFLTSGGFEYNLVLAAVPAGLAFTGPGQLSLDALLDLDLGGVAWGIAAVILGLATAIAQLTVRAEPGGGPRLDLRDQPPVVDGEQAGVGGGEIRR